MSSLLQDVRYQFENVCHQPLKPQQEQSILLKCVHLCDEYGLTPESLALKWQAWLVNTKRSVSEMTMEDLNAFSAMIMIKQAQVVKRTPVTPVKPKQQPQSFASPKLATSVVTDMDIDHTDFYSSPSISSSVIPSATKYFERENRGKIITEHNVVLSDVISGDRGRPTVELASHCIMQPYRYNYDPVPKVAEAISKRLKHLGRAFSEDLQVKSSLSFEELSQDVAIIGCITCMPPESVDVAQKLSPNSTTLQGHINQGSPRAQLLLKYICVAAITHTISAASQSLCIFPGQVALVNGMNPDGLGTPAGAREKTKPLTPMEVIVAAGPFTTSDSFCFEPLKDILELVSKSSPELLVLVLCYRWHLLIPQVGPFVDTAHPLLSTLEVDMVEVFQEQVAKKLAEMQPLARTVIALVPSLRDATHPHFIFPQPPFPDSLFPQKPECVALVSNPCTLVVNNCFTIGATSADIIKDLNKNCITQSKADRFELICDQLLFQRCYYPLYPPEIGVNIDGAHMNGLYMPYTPDLLIVPSDMRPFIKVASGCVCVNPGHIARGPNGGSYARIIVQTEEDGKQLADVIRVSIVNI